MTIRPNASLITLLILALSAPLGGCDATAKLTEQEHIQRAKDFEDKGNLKGSIIELKNAILKNPDSPQARLLLGQIYLKSGMGGEAEKELTQAKKLGVNAETINPYLGEALLLIGEPQRVLDEIHPGEQTSKANLARILQLRADALIRLGKLQDACNLYQQSLDADKGNPPTYWGLAQCAVAERNMTLAKQHLDTALRIQNKQAETWIAIGDLSQLDKNMEGALAAYTSALKIDPDNLIGLHSRAKISISLGRMEPARADIERIRKLYPESLSANYLQALLKFREKQYPEARDALQKALKVAPNYVPSLLLGGLIENALGNLQTAESLLNKVVRAMPRNIFALRLLAATQLRLGRPDDAAKTLAPIDIAKARDAGLHAIAGEVALAKRDFAKAAAHFEAAAEINPESAAIRTELGIARLAQGDSRAIADLQDAAAMDGSSTRADTLIIVNHLKQKQFDAALERIAALEKKQPQSPLAPNYRGVAYLGKQDAAKARNSFEQALKLDPKFFPAAANLAQLDLAEGQATKARSRFENILKADSEHLQAMLAMAELSLRDKDEKSYIGWLEKAVKAHPQSLPPREKMTRYLLTKSEKNRALAIAQEAVNANPDSPEALNLLGATQLAVGDKTGAISTLTTLTKKANQSADAFLRLALAQIANQQATAARSNLQRALQLTPDHLQSQDTLIRLELEENKPESALKIARQIQAQRPRSFHGYLREGDIHMTQKNHASAVRAYQQSLEKGSSSAGFIRLYQALNMAGDKKTAESRLQGWLNKHSADLVVRGFAANQLMAAGRNKEAIAHYQVILQQSPRDVMALNNLANIYHEEKDPRAWTLAEQALGLAPDNPTVLDTAGWILVEQNQIARGLELLRRAVSGAPKNATIRYHHAAALARHGDKTQARNELRKLLADTPNFRDSDNAKALLKSL